MLSAKNCSDNQKYKEKNSQDLAKPKRHQIKGVIDMCCNNLVMLLFSALPYSITNSKQTNNLIILQGSHHQNGMNVYNGQQKAQQTLQASSCMKAPSWTCMKVYLSSKIDRCTCLNTHKFFLHSDKKKQKRNSGLVILIVTTSVPA